MRRLLFVLFFLYLCVLSSALQIIVKQTWSGSREMVGRMNWPLGGGVGTGVSP